MDKPPSGRLLTDRLLELDEARNARPHEPQQASQMVKDRNARLLDQAEKIAALKRAREAASMPGHRTPPAETMPKREMIDTSTDKLGTSFAKSDDAGRSLAADRRRHAKTKVKSGEGDKGDRRRAKRKPTAKGGKKAASRNGAARKPAGKARAKRR